MTAASVGLRRFRRDFIVREMSNEPVRQAPQSENMLVNLAFNVVIPSLLLMKGQKLLHMPSWLVLCVALAFPVCYFILDLRKRKRRNIVSIIGFVSIFITGGVGLLKLPSDWIAIKEAAVPSLFGIAILVSMVSKRPFMQAFLLNPDFFNVAKIESAVKERGAEIAFKRTMRQGTILLALSFVLSAILNYVLARLIVHSPSGSEAFNVELGRMQLLSYPVIALPATLVGMLALWQVMKGIKACTGLGLEDIVLNQEALAGLAAPETEKVEEEKK